MEKLGARGKWLIGALGAGALLLAAGGAAWVLTNASSAEAPAAEARAAGKTAAGAESKKAEKKYTRNVAIVIYEGTEILDFSGPAEVFAAAAGFGANREQKAFKVYTMGTSREPITSQGFIKVTPEYTVDDAPKPDIVVIPGGSSEALTKNEKFMAWAKGAMKDAELTLTVCTGAFVPGAMGMLDGLTVTTFYGAIERLREVAPKATVMDGRRFVDNGAIITTAGVSAGIDGALHTVARLLGRNVADRTARYMEYHWTPESYLAQRYSYFNPSLDERGREAQEASLYEEAKDFERAERAYRAMVERDPKDGFAWYRLGYVFAAQKKMDDAIEANKRAAESSPDMRANALYNAACAYALKGKPDDALDHLKQAVDAGFKNRGHIEADADLASLRGDARYKKLVEAL